MQLRAFRPEDRDWVLAEHARHYTEGEEFDGSFAPVVAAALDGFIAKHDPSREKAWLVEDAEGTRAGCLFLARLDPSCAKLRLFYLVPSARGRGVAQMLFDEAESFAAGAGYEHLAVWTYARHEAAGRLYRRNGFTLVQTRAVHAYGHPLEEQHWQKRLA